MLSFNIRILIIRIIVLRKDSSPYKFMIKLLSRHVRQFITNNDTDDIGYINCFNLETCHKNIKSFINLNYLAHTLV
jgi:hypothetical protein